MQGVNHCVWQVTRENIPSREYFVLLLGLGSPNSSYIGCFQNKSVYIVWMVICNPKPLCVCVCGY